MRGLDLCKAIRNCSPVPIIVLSGSDEVAEKITGLDMGADDYITKPFNSLEVMARVRAVLRRNFRISLSGLACCH